MHGVGWSGVLTSLVVRTSSYVTDFFDIPTMLLSSLSTSNYVSKISSCLLLARPWHRCDQTDVTSSAEKNRPFHVQKLLAHCHFVKWPPTGMKYQKFMACAQKDNKTNGNETQTWQKDIKSFAKRITPQNPQTSKRQRRHVQLPTRRDDFANKNRSRRQGIAVRPLKTTIYPWIMSIPARNSRGFHLVFHPKSGEKHITSPISPSAQVPASNQAVLSNALQAASIPGSSPVLQWHPWHPLQIWSQLSTLERLLMLGICLGAEKTMENWGWVVFTAFILA